MSFVFMLSLLYKKYHRCNLKSSNLYKKFRTLYFLQFASVNIIAKLDVKFAFHPINQLYHEPEPYIQKAENI